MWDLPEPVEPTIAICLLKNLFPFTGTDTLVLSDKLEKVKRSFISILSEYMDIISSNFAGSTFLGGSASESPPR